MYFHSPFDQESYQVLEEALASEKEGTGKEGEGGGHVCCDVMYFSDDVMWDFSIGEIQNLIFSIL